MSTRARIGIVNADKTITSIYTHNDGYISHHGPILLNHYNTAAKVRKLLKLGSLSSLGKELGKKHDFDTSWKAHPTWCCAHGRDRGGESSIDTHENRDEEDFLSEEFAYLFDSGKWQVWDDESTQWNDLTLETIKERMTS